MTEAGAFTDHLAIEWVRYMLITDLVALLVVGGVMWLAYRPHVAHELSVMAAVFGAAFLVIAAGVVVNLTSPVPPTPGAHVSAFAMTALALVAIFLSSRYLRRR